MDSTPKGVLLAVERHRHAVDKSRKSAALKL